MTDINEAGTIAAALGTIEAIVDRPTYVAWRTDWRRRYAEASNAIRSAKSDLVAKRAAWRANAPSTDAESYEYRINSLIENMPWLRRKARILMKERAHATAARDEAFEAKRMASAVTEGLAA